MACYLQSKLESIQFKLRIPQRKPWGAIAEDATSAAITMGQTEKVPFMSSGPETSAYVTSLPHQVRELSAHYDYATSRLLFDNHGQLMVSSNLACIGRRSGA